MEAIEASLLRCHCCVLRHDLLTAANEVITTGPGHSVQLQRF